MRKYFGIAPPTDALGCLQDIHWSHGSFGYFPTYSLGSFYAAQFYAEARLQMPDLEERAGSGNLTGLLQWLREHIHKRGRFFTSEDLCRNVTGKPLDVSYFVNYLLDKYKSIYNL